MSTSRLQHMLNAKERLPANLKALFDLLFVKGMSEEQVCAELKVDVQSVRSDRTALIRSLKTASA